jgi:hypothetical protein
MVTTNVKSHTSLWAFLTASPFWQLFIVLTAGTESCGYLLAPFSALYPVNWIPFLWTHSVCKTTSSRCLLSHPVLNSSGLCVSGETPAFVLCLFGRVCDDVTNRGQKESLQKGTGEVQSCQRTSCWHKVKLLFPLQLSSVKYQQRKFWTNLFRSTLLGSSTFVLLFFRSEIDKICFGSPSGLWTI